LHNGGLVIMYHSIILRGGRVLDPVCGYDHIKDIYIQDNHIVDKFTPSSDTLEVSAETYIVLPGLIDYHTHIFYEGTDVSIPPDLSLLPYGVTSAVDAGTTGVSNYEVFHRHIINDSLMDVRSYISISSSGQVTDQFPENQDPRVCDEQAISRLFSKYGHELLGIKVRESRNLVGDLNFMPLKKAIELANILKCRVAVHMTDSPGSPVEAVTLLRKGDVFAHVFHGKGDTILDKKGNVLQEIKVAQKNGVLFDAANGKNNFSFKTAITAIADGFFPDIISTDLNKNTIFNGVCFNLPWVMSKYIALGMDLMSVVNACTYGPAVAMNMSDIIGSLQLGKQADVSIFQLCNRKCTFKDIDNYELIGNCILIPKMTIKKGRIVFKQIDYDNKG